MFSVVILTLNEEKNLPKCIRSAGPCDDIVVLDSGSTDRTVELARAAGARVFTRKFDNFAGQRNYAQREIPFKHPWVFHLDADEEMTPDLVQECLAKSGDTTCDGMWVAPRMIFQGTWIPRCTDFPAWQARFVRAPQFEFIEVGHGQREAPTMRMTRLSCNYLHDLSSGGEEEWLAKHRRYAKAEAKAYLYSREHPGLGELLSASPLARRRALKELSYRMPFRPLLRFVYQYLLRRGFLDGKAGLRYCLLLSRYESFASEEIRKLKALPG